MNNLIERVKKIIISPKSEWETINTEEISISDLYIKYLIPLALIPAIASFIGYGLIGYRVPFIGHVASLSLGIKHAVISLIITLGGLYLTALVINALATSFGATKNMNKAMQLVVYSYIPALIAGVFYILPSLSPLAMIAGLYSLYLLYVGLQPLMKPASDKVTVYFVLSIVVLIVVYAILGVILSAIFIRTMV